MSEETNEFKFEIPTKDTLDLINIVSAVSAEPVFRLTENKLYIRKLGLDQISAIDFTLPIKNPNATPMNFAIKLNDLKTATKLDKELLKYRLDTRNNKLYVGGVKGEAKLPLLDEEMKLPPLPSLEKLALDARIDSGFPNIKAAIDTAHDFRASHVSFVVDKGKAELYSEGEAAEVKIPLQETGCGANADDLFAIEAIGDFFKFEDGILDFGTDKPIMVQYKPNDTRTWSALYFAAPRVRDAPR
jgi:hypothetical protein